jgi:uncharacterized protein (DUF1330 family)
VSTIEPTREQIAKLAELGDGPVVMINLLAFKQPDGAASYARYGDLVQPHLERAGASIVYAGPQQTMVIGDGTRAWWDLIIAVRYPSVQAFLSMVADPDYQAIHQHRADGLERTELIATAPAA